MKGYEQELFGFEKVFREAVKPVTNLLQNWHPTVMKYLLASLRFMTTISQRRFILMLNRMRRFRVAVSLVVIAQFVLTLSGCGSSSSTTSTTTPASALSAKNVILIIGDGMQLEHERAANNYLFGTPETGLEHQALPYKGVVSTWDVTTYNTYAPARVPAVPLYNDSTVDLNTTSTFTAAAGYDSTKGGKLPYRQDTTGDKTYLLLSATDSASAATALGTGFKTDGGNIAWRTGDPANGRLATIAEMYRNQRKASIGVVSTVPFSHATPAAFVSHNVNRNNYKAIAQEIIMGVRPDVVIAGGNPNYNDPAGISGTNAYQYIDSPEYNYLKGSSNTESKFVERTTGVDGGTALLAAADTAAAGGKKLFGLFGGAGGNFEYHKPSNDGTAAITRGSIENPTLADASTAALKVLSKNSNGFFLMVEQGDIDWANHANSYNDMIGSMWDLNNAVKSVSSYIDNKTNPNVTWDNTLVIVTSDHGNSFMRLQKDLAKGTLPTLPDATAVTYGTTNHTNELVTLYAKGAGSSRFSDFEGLWYPGTRIVDNTHIYKVMMASLGLTDENRSKTVGSQPTSFIYTSDPHYGIKRSVVFGGYSNAVQVNGLMIRSMNNMPNETLPGDSGIKAGQQVGAIDFVAMTGDVSNRSDGSTTPSKNAPAAVTWAQFETDYIKGLTLKKNSGSLTDLFLAPGNHDVSNAIGYYKAPLNAAAGLDATSYVKIYNLMMKPAVALTNTDFVGSTPSVATAAASYASYRVVTSRDVNGVHMVFVGMWPDTLTRTLIDNDLKNVSSTTPVIIFTHDQPNAESKHFTNPNGAKDINTTDKFENLLSDVFFDATTINDASGNPVVSVKEQQAFVDWLKPKKNIVAYFHGNDNDFESYTYEGPAKDVSLPVFRVDSPMKGNASATDPTKLSYSVITIDAAAQNMTVREYLWQQKKWGTSTTVSLAARSK
jgi:alkaline phosphatase